MDNIQDKKYQAFCKLNEIRKLANDMRDWQIMDLISNCTDKDFCLKVIEEYTKILVLKINQSANYSQIAFDFYYWIYFEQDTYPIKSFHDFTNFCIFDNEFSLEYLESVLIKHIDKTAFTDLNSKRETCAYIALGTLIEKGSARAYDTFKYLISDDIRPILKPPAKNFFEFSLTRYFKIIGGESMLRSLRFSIGDDWENICNKVCGQSYEVFISHPTLVSGAIPDIVVGENIDWLEQRIKHAPTIIECKKSVYYGRKLNYIDLLNNSTTAKYLPYCDCLEYWILDEPLNFERPVYDKVKYIFANEILNFNKLSDSLILEIAALIDKSNLLNNTKIKSMSPSELIELIDLCQDS